MHQTRTYKSWNSMLNRVRCRNAPDYARYGGRGIRVCDRWLAFANFLADMGERPDGMSLDRIDNDGDYTPENCRWASSKEQTHNSRTTKVNGVGVAIMRHLKRRGQRTDDIAHAFGLAKSTTYAILAGTQRSL